MVWIVLLVVAVILVVLVRRVASGATPVDGLAPAVRSTPDHGLPVAPSAEDVDAVRFDTAPRGYAVAEVDSALQDLRARLAQQEEALGGDPKPGP